MIERDPELNASTVQIELCYANYVRKAFKEQSVRHSLKALGTTGQRPPVVPSHEARKAAGYKPNRVTYLPDLYNIGQEVAVVTRRNLQDFISPRHKGRMWIPGQIDNALQVAGQSGLQSADGRHSIVDFLYPATFFGHPGILASKTVNLYLLIAEGQFIIDGLSPKSKSLREFGYFCQDLYADGGPAPPQV